MSRSRPRQLVHRGVVAAHGYLFPGDHLEPSELRRRVLALWQAGPEGACRLYRVPPGWVLLLPAPAPVQAESAPGLPLVRWGNAFFGVPLSPAERSELTPPPRSLVLMWGGQLRVEVLSDDQLEDPAGWLDVSAWHSCPVQSLGSPPPEPVAVLERPEFNSRSRMGGVPPPAPELLALLSGRTAGQPGSLAGMLRSAAGLVSRLLQGGPSPSPPGGAPPARRPGRLKQFGANFLNWTQLSRLLGPAHAAYLARLVTMLERGDLREALRHAMPLGGSAQDGPAFPWLGRYQPRSDLSLSPHLGSGGGALALGPDLYQYLRSLYRKAFERLRDAGQIDEAAFVLADLLVENEEAVAFLERHERFRLAAELAEARSLAPGLVIRQWMLAGDVERAVRLALRAGAFAEAVLQLERAHPELAARFRRLWAENLVVAGDYVGAVQAAWPVEAARPTTRAWIEEGAAAGGPAGARMLARWVQLDPGAFSTVRERLLAGPLDTADPEQLPALLAFSATLRDGARSPESSTLARAAVRALGHAGFTGSDPRVGDEFRRLLNFANDGALRADAVAPPLPPDAPRGGALQHEWTFSAADVGATPLQDAALLPDGRLLVALGEAGVRLLTHDARVVADLKQPAHYLVVARHGQRAIALARRGNAYRLARLNLTTFQATSWCEARLTCFARDYDGALWYAANGDTFLVLDATAGGLEALWRHSEPGAVVADVAWSAETCAYLVQWTGPEASAGQRDTKRLDWECWRYSLPGPVLRQRVEIPPCAEGATRISATVSPGGRAVLLSAACPQPPHAAERNAQPHFLTLLHQKEPIRCATQGIIAPLPLAMNEAWLAAPFRSPLGIECEIYTVENGRRAARITLEGARSAAFRLSGDHLVVADDRGRLVTADLRTGRLLRDLRL